MKNIIIAGASGYVGKSFLSEIGKLEDINAIALCISKEEFAGFEISSNIKVLTNEEFFNLNNLFENINNENYLINFAFPRKDNINDIVDAFEYMYKLYAKSFELGAKYIINTSSQSVYDINRKKAAKETDLLKPFSVYGLAKIFTEKYTKDFCINNNIKYINIRLASIIGPGFEQRIVNKLINQYLNNENIDLIEKEEVFSYLNVSDAVKGYIAILTSKNIIWNKEYNLGINENYTITDILNLIKNVTEFEYKGKINILKELPNKRTNEVNIEEFKKNINWKPKMYLNDSVKEIFEYIIKNLEE